MLEHAILGPSCLQDPSLEIFQVLLKHPQAKKGLRLSKSGNGESVLHQLAKVAKPKGPFEDVVA